MCVHNKKEVLVRPVYSDSLWLEARSIWGQKESGLVYEYSDRLWEWDYSKADAASKQASEKLPGHKFTPEYIELFLTLYYGRPVDLRHVMGGVNWSNSYEYFIYGFVFKDVVLVCKDVPAEVIARLREFKAANGRTWKARLRHLWNIGQDEGLLRQARNIIGPSNLDKLKL